MLVILSISDLSISAHKQAVFTTYELTTGYSWNHKARIKKCSVRHWGLFSFY
ncbi:hypothetical protein Pan153_53250 [Gimesia panareensis]|uniref:Uncharacterized protein n=1 Tax=Gimesia panareensis TaxID=2527978 RepID=A0A518FWC1_9PLAN|nr:hypothetical protein Pan153_53250 [Gimesia panareensis]